MRRLLISVAVLALAGAPAFAQPEQEHGHGHRDAGPGQGGQEHGGPDRGGPGPGAERPSAPQPQVQAAPARGGPTNFTNQVQGHQPDQGQQRQGTWSRDPNRPMQGQPPNLVQQRERGNGPPPQAAAPQPPPDQNRGNRQGNFSDRGNKGFGDRGNTGRDFRTGDRNGGRPGNPAFNGPRRDYSGFRDFHRDFRSTRRFRIAPYRPPAGFYARRWTFGEFLPSLFWGRNYWLLDFAD